ncbi:MAG TPA: hypothetical protein VFZ61_22835 [Polyangiales bacterium]
MTRIPPTWIDLACAAALFGLAFSAGCGGDDEPGPSTPPAQSSTDAGGSPAQPGEGAAADAAVVPGSATPATPTVDASSERDADSSSDAGPPSTDAGGGGKDDAGAPDVPEMYKAVAAIRDAFKNNAYADYANLAKGIDAAAKSYPDDATIARYAAVLRLWRLTESSRDPKLGLLDLAPVLLEAQSRFETARRLAPSDGRLVGWSGALTLRSGQALGLAPQIEMGKQELEASIATYPGFNLFVQGAALSALPRTDPDHAKAADKMYESLKTCGYDLDPDNPVLPAMPVGAGKGGVCEATAYAPHNLEGLFLNLGDAVLKRGQPEIAKVLYKNAMTGPAYASWPYRDLLEKRITDAEANAATYTDSDPNNDFKMSIEAGYFCVSCHATRL